MRDRLAPPIQAIMEGSEEPFDDRFAVAAAVFRAVVTAAEYRPLLITVDDAQWLDNASVAVLIFIVRRLYADAIAIVLAHRAGEPEKFPADWPHLALTPLGTEDVCQMIAAQRRDLPPVHRNVGESITERSGGNPLVLSELMPYLTAAQCTGAASLPDPLPLGERGRLNFGRQIGALPDRTRTALALVAAAGSQPLLVPPALARLGREPADLDPAIEAGILTEPPQYQFSHPLRRSAAYLGVPAACRRNIHEVLAELNRGQDVERYAWHLDRAAAAPDVVADATELAAQDISTRAGPAAAGPSWARSAELTADPSTRRRRALQAASSYFQAGDVKACNRWLADAFAGPTSSGQLVHDETAAEALLLKCQVSVWHPVDRASIDALVADAERLAVDDPPRAVYALGMLAAAYENRGDLPDSMRVTAEARQTARKLGGDELFLAECWAAHTFTLSGGARAATPIRELIPPASVSGLADRTSMVLWWAAQTAMWQEDLSFADDLTRAIVAGLRRRSVIAWLPYALSVEADIRWRTGAWARARAAAAEALELADTAGQRGLVGFTLAIAGLIAGTTGRAEESASYVRRALTLVDSTGLVPVGLYARHAAGARELARGRPSDAVPLLAEAHKIAVAVQMGQPSVVPYHADYVEALLRAAQPSKAATMLGHLEDVAGASGSRWAAAAALRCRAMLHADEPASEDLLRASVQQFTDTIPMPFERCRSQLELGALLRRRRRIAEARPILSAAATGFRELGAVDWAHQADAERRAVGDREAESHPARTGKLSQLTPQQVQVVLAVTDGATNREAAAALFVSPKTIDYHLRRAYTTLGVHNRVELTRLVSALHS
jgi:DNA-binding CsgD family transcriptional regulator